VALARPRSVSRRCLGVGGGAALVTLSEVQCAVQDVTGDPELVIVDRRTLRLLMAGLEPLIILAQFDEMSCRRLIGTGQLQPALPEEKFVWDDDPLC